MARYGKGATLSFSNMLKEKKGEENESILLQLVEDCTKRAKD